jgi:hypothetical protein
MSDTVDQEVEAIKSVLAALAPLSAKARVSVLEYAMKRLDVIPSNVPTGGVIPLGQLLPLKGEDKGGTPSGGSPHIKDFKQAKKPRSANEMAALVAYYLMNLAPQSQRKDTVTQGDMETYFKIAGYPLPNQIRVTLQNAKAAGYFDSAGSGEYKLNAVGHNLVAHSMPRGSAEENKQKYSRKKKVISKKAKLTPRKTKAKSH